MDKGNGELSRNPREMKVFISSIPIPCYIWQKVENSKDFILHSYNQAALNISNQQVKKLIGKRASIIFSDKNDIMENLNTSYQEKKKIRKERPYSAYSLDKEEYFEFTYNFLAPNFVVMFTKSIKKRLEAQRQVVEERNRYQNLLHNLPITIYSVLPDVPSTLEFISGNITNWTGYKTEDFRGEPLLIIKMIHPEDKEKVFRAYNKAFKEIKKYDIEYRIIHKKTRKIRYVRDYAIPIVNKKKESIKYHGMIIDITARRLAEKKLQKSKTKLKESEKKFRTIAEQSLVGIQIIQNGELKYINKRARSFTGITNDEIMKSDFTRVVEMIHPEDRDKVKKKFAQRLKSGSKNGPAYEFRILLNEKVKWLESHSKKIMYEGKPADLIILADITDRKLVEQSLKETASLFKNLAEQSSTGIQIVQEGMIKYVNKKWAEIFELTLEDLTNKPAIVGKKYIHPEDLELVQEQIRLSQEKSKNAKGRYDFRIITKSGKVKWLDIFYKDIIYQGKSASFVTIVDITEKKQIEEELIKLNKLKSQFLRRTSHELKTPLISIKGYADLLIDLYIDKLPHKFLEIVGEIKEGVLRLEDLIKELLKGAQLEKGKIQLKPSKEDLSFLIRFTMNELKHLAEKRNQNINIDILNDMVTDFEKEKIYEVLKNLLSNAIKYTPEYGEITIKSERTDNSYLISIEDTGIGFTEEEKEHVFTRFGKIERYGQGFDLGIDGTGLGLYISKKVIELHGGDIWMESKGRNKGSTFHFTIPIKC